MTTILEPSSQAGTSVSVQQTEDVKKLAHGAGIATFGRVAGRGLNFLVQIILARLLGPDEFGLYVIGWTFIRIVSIVGTLGLDQGVIKFGTKHWQTDQSKFREVFYFSALLSVGSGLLLGGLLFLVAPILATVVFKKPDLELVFRCFSIAMPFVTLLRLVAATTTISQKLKYATYAEELTQPASELVLVIGFYFFLKWRLIGAVIAGGASFVIALCLAIFYLIKLFPELLNRERISLTFHKELVTFSLPTALAGLFGSSIMWVDRLLVGIFLTQAETGIYTTVSLVSIVFATILSGVKVIISPMVAELSHKKEVDRVEELYRVSTKWATYVSLPMILVILFASKDLLALSFGTPYLAGQTALLILTITQLINVGTGANDMILIMTGYQKHWLTISAAMLGMNILLNSFLIPKFGLVGAALGTSLSVSGIFILGVTQVKRLVGIWPYDRRYLKGVWASLITASVMEVAKLLKITLPFLNILLLAALAVFVFYGSLLVLKIAPEDRQLLQLIKQRVGKVA